MPDGHVLEFDGVTKRFGAVTAVSDFSVRVEPGAVTGFLGPNGAGKTTTLRVLLGLVRATAGTATIGGKPYSGLARPLQTVGAVLEASSFHPGRSAANHLKIYAQAAGIPVSRVDEVLATVGLADVAGSRVGGFSLGMKQRLSLAYALLGDPGVLILDEPANGLDPEGIIWMRSLLRELARQGRTVLVSSHLLAEVQQTVDALLIITQGRLVFSGSLDELTDPDDFVTVVDSPDRVALSTALRDAGAEVDLLRSGLTVHGSTPAEVGAIAAGAGVGLSLLQRRGPGLEEIFLDLVNGARVHGSGGGADRSAPPLPVEESPPPPAADATDTSAARDAAASVVPASPRAVSEADPEFVDEPTDASTSSASTSSPADEGDVSPARPAFAVATTGVIDIVPGDDAAPNPYAVPEFFAPGDSVADPAPGAADDDADPNTDDIIVPASDPSTDSDIEVEKRPKAPRWLAQADPVVDPEVDAVSESDADADEFFTASTSAADDTSHTEEGDRR